MVEGIGDEAAACGRPGVVRKQILAGRVSAGAPVFARCLGDIRL
jgi:hypothetical protein